MAAVNMQQHMQRLLKKPSNQVQSNEVFDAEVAFLNFDNQFSSGIQTPCLI